MTRDPEDVLEQLYYQVYEALYASLREQRRTDPSFTIEKLRGFLKSAYVHQGNDWAGRGSLFEATQAATIAAYEAVLAEWESEIDKQSNG